MKTEMLVLRPGIQLIQYETPYALFSYYENLHHLKLEGNAFPLQELLDFLSMPKEIHAIEAKFVSTPQFSANFALLKRSNYIVETASELKDQIDVDPTVRLCSHFYHSVAKSDSVVRQSRLKSISVVDHLGLKHEIVEAFSELKLEDVKVHDSHLEIQNHKPDIVLVISSWSHAVLLNQLNRFCLEKKIEFFLVLIDAFGGSIGPVLASEHGPCFTCLQSRRKTNLSNRTWIETFEKWTAERTGSVDLALFPPFSRNLLRMAAVETFKRLTKIADFMSGHGLNEIDLLNNRTQMHEILPTPYCPDCFPNPQLFI